jgi:hypothetical protein
LPKTRFGLEASSDFVPWLLLQTGVLPVLGVIVTPIVTRPKNGARATPLANALLLLN